MHHTLVLVLLALQAALVALAQSTGSVRTSGTNKCLDVAGGTLANGAREQIKTCSVAATPSQTWQFQAATVSGKTVLRTSNGFCLDVPSGRGANGVALQLWTCNRGSINQFFARDGNNIRWNGSKYCLDVSDGTAKGFADGLAVQLWECNLSSANQVFTGPSATSTMTTTTTSSTTSSTSSSTPSPTQPSSKSGKPALRSIFKPTAKRMLAWGYDNRVAGTIGSGSKISSYHHWENDVVTQMPAKVTYCPTYWGTSKKAAWTQAKKTLGNTIPPVVLGFNEPDIASQANMSPNVAAQVFFDEITVPFGRRGSNVVSPAIVWDVNNWLVPFMARCGQLGCGIDAIGQHIYVGLNGNVDAAVESVKKQITTVYSRFGMPIVLSEIGLTQAGGGSDAQINDFVTKVGRYLDGTDYVLAWALAAVFRKGDGWDGYLNSNMAFYNADGSLSSLGRRYMDATF